MSVLRATMLTALTATMMVFLFAAPALAATPAEWSAASLQSLSFETSASTFTTIYPVIASGEPTPVAMWGRVTGAKHAGSYGLWCAGMRYPSLLATAYAATYPSPARSTARLDLPELTDYYSSSVDFFYNMPTLGDADSLLFNLRATDASGNPTGGNDLRTITDTTAVGGWTQNTFPLAPLGGSVVLSRKAGAIFFGFNDLSEAVAPLTGQGPTIDDVTVTGFKYGPVRNLGGSAASTSVALSWTKPYRSKAATSAEERALTYRVWRAPAGTTEWVELTTDTARAATESYLDTNLPGSGLYDYAVQAWDTGVGSGRGELAPALRLTLVAPDLTPPTTTTNVDGAWHKGSFNVSLTATDTGGSTVASTFYSLAAGPRLTYSTPFTWSTEGTTTLEFRSTDTAGNSETTQTATILIDASAPISQFNGVPSGWATSSVPVSIGATDTLSGVAGVAYKVGTGSVATYSAPFVVSAEGTTTLFASAVDNAGNREVTQTASVRIDTHAPTTTASAATSYRPGTAITLSATDAASGVQSTFYRVTSESAVFVPGASVTVTTTLGGYTLEYYSVDNAGNRETTRTKSFSVTNADPVVNRIGGANRYAVAANMAATAYPGWVGVDDVIIACGEDRANADPLAAAGLAGVYDAPILLTESWRLNPTTKNTLTRIAAANPNLKIYVVGGPASVPQTVLNSITAISGVNKTVTRISGADRYEVTANIATRMVAVKGAAAIPGVLIVCGSDANAFYDALAAGPIAANQHMPMLAVRPTSVSTSVNNVLNGALAGKPRYVVSSTTYVSASVYNAIAAPVPGSERLTGSKDRYTAARDIADAAVDGHGWLSAGDTAIAAKLPDALTGGAFVGKKGSVLLFTDSTTTMKPVLSAWIADHKPQVLSGWVLGGEVSVTPSVMTQYSNLLK